MVALIFAASLVSSKIKGRGSLGYTTHKLLGGRFLAVNAMINFFDTYKKFKIQKNLSTLADKLAFRQECFI